MPQPLTPQIVPAATAAAIALPQHKAAALVGVSVRTLYRWEKAGLVQGRRVTARGAKLYPVEALRRLATGAAQ